MTKMNPEVKAKWVAALRSGEYRQGKGELRDEEERFCCLGVLCAVQGVRCISDGGYSYEFNGQREFELPPRTLRAEWGFDWEKVDVEINGHSKTLYDHNDSGRTFAEIADAIEAQL